MRTTIDLESDVLAAAKELARQQHTSVSKIISQLARRGLIGTPAPQSVSRQAPIGPGFEPFPARGVIVSNKLIDRLRDAEGI